MVRLTNRLELLTENSGDDSLSMKLLGRALAARSDAVFPSSKSPFSRRDAVSLWLVHTEKKNV
jgi:hypothetical protein